MKKTGLLLLLALWAHQVFAQAPSAIPYQAVARDASGNLISNQAVSLRFTIHTNAAAGPVVYQETWTATTSALGLFTLSIGQGTPNSAYGPFSSIDWSSGSKFTQVEIDVNGGTAYVDMGTQQMLSVPYALFAAKSLQTYGAVTYVGTWDTQANSPALSSATGTKGFYYVVINASSDPSHNTALNGIDDWGTGDWAIYNGTGWEKVDNTTTVSDASAVPFTPGSSVISTNVQAAIEEVESQKVNKSGDAMTGDLILNADPTLALGAVTKQYADALTTASMSSYIHRLDDGITIYEPSPGARKRFGIGDTTPLAPLGIVAEGTSERVLAIKPSVLTAGSTYTFSLNVSSHRGLSVEEEFTSGGSANRLFIQESDGYIGIGTALPDNQLHVKSVVPAGLTGVQISNSASTVNNGWIIGHRDDPTGGGNGCLAFIESTVNYPEDRMLIGLGGNVGINESDPDVKLHVTRSPSDPNASISLIENTGIMVTGPIDDDHLVYDYRGIQARHGEFIGTTLDITASELNLQRLGGEIMIHGDASSATEKIVITANGNLGVGKLTPVEKVEINGAIVLGTTFSTTPADGTIRFNGTDFEGFKDGDWGSFTSSAISDGFANVGSGMIAYAPSNPKVGIGIAVPTATLHVSGQMKIFNGTAPPSGLCVAGEISNDATNSAGTSDNRIGLKIQNSGSWGGSSQSKDIGLYVASVTGQSNHESNIAALINGNVVIGDASAAPIVGSAGKNVLAIQNGTAPSSQAGVPLLTDGGIQVYSAADAIGTSVFHLMNGDGTIMKLYRSAPLSPPSTETVDTAYGTEESNVINNMRDRINELEAKLQAFGLIP